MGFIKAIGRVTQAAADVVATPFEVVKDVIDYVDGGPVENTTSRLHKMKNNLEGAYDALDED